jgi:hypothetical protein
MFGGPMSLVIVVVCVTALVGGVIALRRGLRAGRERNLPIPCPRCRHRNAPQARFCGHCGGPLADADA